MTTPEVRPNIAQMQGYVPGEQPHDVELWTKLNTNENPYPPSPRCADVLKHIDISMLHLYPNPTSDGVRDVIAKTFGFERDQVVVGNGSDDILNMAIRIFCDSADELAMVTPSYSLYASLAEIQGATMRQIPLTSDFGLPADFMERIQGTKLLMIPSPNAPTSTIFPLETLEKIIETFQGAVLIDEAYVDFAQFNALSFVNKYKNVIVSRTLSKSYALAGLRVGFALSTPEIIASFMKVKDSYNVNYLSQELAKVAIEDQDYLREISAKIVAERERATQELTAMGFKVLPSHTNFLFAMPPNEDGKSIYEALKSQKILVRFFAGEVTGKFVRITIGTPAQMDKLYTALRKAL